MAQPPTWIQVVTKCCLARVCPPEWGLTKQIIQGGNAVQNAVISVVPCTSIGVTYKVTVTRTPGFELCWMANFIVSPTGDCTGDLSFPQGATITVTSGPTQVDQITGAQFTVGQETSVCHCVPLESGMCAGPFTVTIEVPQSICTVAGVPTEGTPPTPAKCCDLQTVGGCAEPCRCLWDSSECSDGTGMQAPQIEEVDGLNPQGPLAAQLTKYLGTRNYPIPICPADFQCGPNSCSPISLIFSDTITAPDCSQNPGCSSCVCTTTNTATLIEQDTSVSPPVCPTPADSGCPAVTAESTLTVQCVPLILECSNTTKCADHFCLCKRAKVRQALVQPPGGCCVLGPEIWLQANCGSCPNPKIPWPVTVFEFPGVCIGTTLDQCSLLEFLCPGGCAPQAAGGCFLELFRQYLAAVLNINKCFPGTGSAPSTFPPDIIAQIPEQIYAALVGAQLIIGAAWSVAGCVLCAIEFPFPGGPGCANIIPVTITLTNFNSGTAGYSTFPSCDTTNQGCVTVIDGAAIDYTLGVTNQSTKCEVCPTLQVKAPNPPAYVLSSPFTISYTATAQPSGTFIASGFVQVNQSVNLPCLVVGVDIPADTTSIQFQATYSAGTLDTNTGQFEGDAASCPLSCSTAVDPKRSAIPLALQDCLTIGCPGTGGCSLGCGTNCAATIIPTGDQCIQDLVNSLFSAGTVIAVPGDLCSAVIELTEAQKVCLFGDGTPQNPPHDITYTLQFASECCGCCISIRNQSQLIVGDNLPIGCDEDQLSHSELQQSSVLNTLQFPGCCAPRVPVKRFFGQRRK